MTKPKGDRKDKSVTLQGIGVSPGIASGVARLLVDPARRPETRELREDEIPGEIARFQDALIATRRQLDDIRQHVSKAIDAHAAAIFDSHLLIIDNRTLLKK